MGNSPRFVATAPGHSHHGDAVGAMPWTGRERSPSGKKALHTRAWGSEQGHGKNRWWALDEPIEERTVNMVTEHCGRQRHMIEPWIFVAEADFQYNWNRSS